MVITSQLVQAARALRIIHPVSQIQHKPEQVRRNEQHLPPTPHRPPHPTRPGLACRLFSFEKNQGDCAVFPSFLSFSLKIEFGSLSSLTAEL